MGTVIQWRSEYSVGIQDIDEQHKVLIGIIKEKDADYAPYLIK